MGRSIKKGPYVQPVLLKRIQQMNEAGEKKILKTWSRSSTIFPDFVVCSDKNLQGSCRF